MPNSPRRKNEIARCVLDGDALVSVCRFGLGPGAVGHNARPATGYTAKNQAGDQIRNGPAGGFDLSWAVDEHAWRTGGWNRRPADGIAGVRSEERPVGEECRS